MLGLRLFLKENKMTKNLVEQLRYAASDEGGQFCEALIITSGGKEHYVLHFYHSHTTIGDEKVDYTDRRKMVLDFPYGPGGFGDRHKHPSWKKTDAQCGYSDVPVEEFQKARRMGLEKRI